MDGERNLKPKLAPLITQKSFFNIIKIKNSKVAVKTIDPTKEIYRFEGELKDYESDQTNILDLK